MKKFIKLGVLAVICTTILTGYSSAQSKTTTSAVTIDPTLTPENSCVIFFVSGLEMDFIQIDPTFPHDKQVITVQKLYSTPLIPGSTYICEGMHIGNTVWDGYPCIENSMSIGYLNYSEKNNFEGYKLRVPKEPGFYYCYSKKIHEENGENSWVLIVSKTVDEEFLKRNAKYYNEHIKTCAKIYAGTAWESVINEQVEVWTK